MVVLFSGRSIVVALAGLGCRRVRRDEEGAFVKILCCVRSARTHAPLSRTVQVPYTVVFVACGRRLEGNHLLARGSSKGNLSLAKPAGRWPRGESACGDRPCMSARHRQARGHVTEEGLSVYMEWPSVE